MHPLQTLETNKAEAVKRKQYVERTEELSEELAAMVQDQEELKKNKGLLAESLKEAKEQMEAVNEATDKEEANGKRLKDMLRSEDVKKEYQAENEKLE